MDRDDIQEIKKKKRSLKRYRFSVACIERLEDKLRLLDGRIKSIKSPNFSGMPRGGTPVTIEELLSDKIDLEKRIERLKKKSRGVKAQILDEIDSLEDVRHAYVLESYFIDCLRISEIAEDMGYSEVHIYNLYREAIEQLTFTNTLE